MSSEKSQILLSKRRKTKYPIPLNRSILQQKVNGDLGIEIELEGVLPPNISYTTKGFQWVVKPDNSLRNGGLEYVTSTAIPIDDVEDMVNGFYAELATNSRLELSTRCSTHVHVNMQDMTVHQLCSFVTLWAMFEEVFVNWCGPNRVGNLFCLRLQDSVTAVNKWVEAFRTGRFRFNNDHKYLALNGAAFNNFGSFEIRTLEGCDNPERVLKWCKALYRLKCIAKTYATPEDIVSELSGVGGKGFLVNCLTGLDIVPELIDVSENEYALDIDKSVIQGLRRIQEVTYCLPWHDLLDEINKTYIPDPFSSTLYTEIALNEDISVASPGRLRSHRLGSTWDTVIRTPSTAPSIRTTRGI